MYKEDYFSNDVDGARGHCDFNDDGADWDATPDDREEDEHDGDQRDEYPEDYEPECNCSDPGCPCGGRKIGRL